MSRNIISREDELLRLYKEIDSLEETLHRVPGAQGEAIQIRINLCRARLAEFSSSPASIPQTPEPPPTPLQSERRNGS
jgi:hypothetical protein